MSADLLDDDGYPSDATLDRIRAWGQDLTALFAFVRSCWRYADIGYWSEEDGTDDVLERPVRRYLISTGGWSGNESIIAALRKNVYAWHFSWAQSRRGGHYIFEVVQTPAAERGK